MNQQSGLSLLATELLSEDPDDFESPDEDPPQPASDNASVAAIMSANTFFFFHFLSSCFVRFVFNRV